MATKKKKIMLFIFVFVLLFLFSILFAPFISYLIEKNPINKISILSLLSMYKKLVTYKILILLIIISLTLSSMMLLNLNWYKSRQVNITEDISIPVSTGQNQYGSASFAQKSQYDSIFSYIEIDMKNETDALEAGKRIQEFIENNKEKIDEQIKLKEQEY